MKWLRNGHMIRWYGIIGLLLGVACPAISDASLITCRELHNLLQNKISPDEYLVINVLSRSLCADCTIPGSINIPYEKLEKKLYKVPRDQMLVVYCVGNQCPLSRYAQGWLQKLGFQSVYILQDGLTGWVRNKLPVIGRCKARYVEEAMMGHL